VAGLEKAVRARVATAWKKWREIASLIANRRIPLKIRGCFILRPCQHDDGYIDGRSQIKVNTNERTQVHSAPVSVHQCGP